MHHVVPQEPEHDPALQRQGRVATYVVVEGLPVTVIGPRLRLQSQTQVVATQICAAELVATKLRLDPYPTIQRNGAQPGPLRVLRTTAALPGTTPPHRNDR